jgi:hypothetical protein
MIGCFILFEQQLVLVQQFSKAKLGNFQVQEAQESMDISYFTNSIIAEKLLNFNNGER